MPLGTQLPVILAVKMKVVKFFHSCGDSSSAIALYVMFYRISTSTKSGLLIRWPPFLRPAFPSRLVLLTCLSQSKSHLRLSLSSVASICLLVIGGIVGGAGAGKFHGWLSGIGAVATVGSMDRAAIITEVCVIVWTWLSDAHQQEGLAAARAANHCWARLCETWMVSSRSSGLSLSSSSSSPWTALGSVATMIRQHGSRAAHRNCTVQNGRIHSMVTIPVP